MDEALVEPAAGAPSPDEPTISASVGAPVLGRRVILLRHGQTTWNTQGRWQGHLDPGLDEVGWQQATRAANLLRALHPHVLVSSDLRRAHSTAEVLARTADLPLAVDARLRETDLGLWSGLTTAEIKQRWPGQLDRWFTGAVDLAPEQGENRLEVAQRMVAGITQALHQVPDGGSLVVVTHGGAARVAIASILGLEHASWGAIGGLSNCCWSLLGERAGQPNVPVRWRLVEHNAGTLPQPALTEEG